MSLSTTEESRLPLGGPTHPRRPAWMWIAGLVALAAGGLCIYLAWAAIAAGGRVAGCGGDGNGDCAGVLLSRWARWFGLPVAVPAALVYGGVLVALFALARSDENRQQLRAWYVLVPLATLILVAAAWFSALQLLVLGKLCWYCLAVHGCATILAMTLLWHVPHDWRIAVEIDSEPVGLRPMTTLGLVLCGFLGLVVLIAGQLLSNARQSEVEITTVASPAEMPQPAAEAANASGKPETSPKSAAADAMPIDLSDYFPVPEVDSLAAESRPRRISLIGGKAILDVRRTPLLGEADAEFVVVELFDYTCPHCRQLHRYLSEARRRYGAQLAVAVLVTPMDPRCNGNVKEPATEPGSCELARLAVAVWQTRPAAFAPFHDWLMESTETRTVEAARARAIEILGGDVLDQAADVLDRAVADGAVTREIDADNRVYQLAGTGTIPKLLTERLIVAGQPSSAEKLFEVLEQQVGLRPLSDAAR